MTSRAHPGSARDHSLARGDAQPSAMLPSQVLDAAADLIEPEGRWTQGTSARDVRGDPISPTNIGAICWCVVGGVVHVDPVSSSSGLSFLWATLPSGATAFNDAPDRTQAEVVKALRDAAELARSEGR